MMKAYKHLVKYALSAGCTVSVWDGEEWQIKRSTGYRAIIDAVESVEQAQIRIRDAGGNMMGWASIIPSLDDDETVADHSDNLWMNDWSYLSGIYQ